MGKVLPGGARDVVAQMIYEAYLWRPSIGRQEGAPDPKREPKICLGTIAMTGQAANALGPGLQVCYRTAWTGSICFPIALYTCTAFKGGPQQKGLCPGSGEDVSDALANHNMGPNSGPP